MILFTIATPRSCLQEATVLMGNIRSCDHSDQRQRIIPHALLRCYFRVHKYSLRSVEMWSKGEE